MYVLQRESDRICGLGKRRKNERMPKTSGLRQAIRRKQRGQVMNSVKNGVVLLVRSGGLLGNDGVFCINLPNSTKYLNAIPFSSSLLKKMEFVKKQDIWG